MTRFPIVGIGTSAGGLAALQQFFEHMPADAGMAFVIVQHLDPTVESHLAELLSRVTQMPVVPIKNGMRVRPDHVYTIVPDRYVRIANGVLHLERPTERRGMRSAIDVFFRSLAEDLAESAICLVLSGAGTNGTAGVRAIKTAGGLAIAQDPATAQYPAMPLSASSVGMADSVLSPAEMPKALMNYVRTGSHVAKEDESPSDLDGLLSLVQAKTGQDFRGYKKSTLTRRIYRRMALAHIEDIGTYLTLLRDRPDELHTLVRDLLINVTSFFRDPDAWEALAKQVIAPLIRSKKPDEPLRIWVPACATGEEAYSLGMLVLEEMHAQSKTLDVRIFATDAEQEVVSQARAAVYPTSIAAEVSPQRLSLFFDKEGESYRVKRVLREMMTFAPQNILRDPPFSHMDLISCRNVLIYLEADVQRHVSALMHFALSEGGYLFLSTAESIGDRDELFETVSKKWHIYRRVGGTRHDLVDFSPGAHQIMERTHAARAARTIGLADHARSALAELFAPPSVLIDQKLRVLLFHGDTGRFLAQPPGEPTDAVLALARDGLRSRLRAVIQQASRERVAVSTEARLKETDGYRTTRITATPMHGILESFLLVSFDEPAVQVTSEFKEETAEGSERELEEELRTTKEELRATIEQLEVSNEELKASNEEITSMTEELQSTNEELETSKEELQSVNEELTTLNSQLQSKVSELEDRTNDLHNLLRSTDIATLFLDSNLRIKGFTPAVKELLNVIPSDVGRPLEHLSRKFEDPTLSDDVSEVLRKLVPKEAEIKDVQNRWYLRRVLPYRTEDNRIAGVVIAFIEITERRHWQEQIIQAKQYAEHIVDSVRHPLVLLDKDLRIRTANEAFSKLLDLSPQEIVGKSLSDFADGLWRVPAVRKLFHDIKAEGEASPIEAEVEYRHLGLRAMELRARRLDSGHMTLLALEDVTEHRAAERRLRFAMSELLHRVRNILANVRAIAVQSRDHTDSLPEFWEAFSGRLDSLASIQSLLAISKDSAVTIEEILLEELRTYSTPGDERYTISGPSVTLKADAAQTLTMILHELTTNSAKYGALSTDGGTIAISWGLKGAHLQFSWIEHGVPDVPKPEHRGFGTLLIEDGVPYTLAGTARLDFHEDGIACTIELPLGVNIRPPVGERDATANVE
jgi:two-component system CheB/CheR fusion protein